MTTAKEDDRRRGKIIVLGATGKLGRMVCRLWPSRGELVTIARKEGLADITWKPGDDVPAVMASETRAILALWGATSGVLSDNARLAEAALDLAVVVGARQVVHISSAAVYGVADRALHEADALQPVGPYSVAKCDMEDAIAAWHRGHGEAVRSIVLRLGNVAGADSLGQSLRRGPTVTLDHFPDGTGPQRSYIGPVDLVRVFKRLTKARALSDTYNVAAPQATAMADIVTAAGMDARWTSAPPGAIQSVVLDTSKLGRLLPDLRIASSPAELVVQARAGGFLPCPA
ncbi:NAD(P)-dependent oxidoreductase [Sagittula sp. MA-2]|jgi:nucleoside-diphosphate-sugar epimerase|uniref:NAD-dependent epimerase/dehydratase family protein n=1 Tax=Sagittula sp. MA-2 TaxID=3048007 RepID=UPI0024C32C33|nr:NAD(P)-dependent oxidoreductase [Sagittula sp. MA-2]WHZ35173.1 NAD(P)-dependent oxidoreductase [Sagittula sp. MA-2]